jgi:uncharacterized protein YybS (DUF2232 family)
MLTDGRRRIDYVCALAIALFFPLALRHPPLMILSVLGLIGVYYLWLARQYWLLALSLMLALIGTLMWRGTGGGIVLISGLVLPAMAMAFVRSKGFGAGTAVAAGTFFPAIVIAVNYDFFARLVRFLGVELRQMALTAQMPGVYTLQQQNLVIDTMNRFADNLPYYFPAAILLLTVAMFSASVLVGNYLARAAGIFARPISEFSLWKLPEWLVIPVGVAVIMVLTNHSALAIIGWNVLLFFGAMYSICGLSLVEYVLRTRRFPPAAKIAIYLFLFLTQIVAGIVLPLVALLDSKFDFRKIRAKQLG